MEEDMTNEEVSIHAPARGATADMINIDLLQAFQSTPPRGGRRLIGLKPPSYWRVSIHAPARGATCLKRKILCS